MARKRANLSDLLNNLTYRTLFDKYRLIAENSWEWKNLPDGIPAHFIEKVLFSRGYGCFFKARGMGLMFLECDGLGQLNIYGEELVYRAHGYRFQQTVDADKCVIVRNNILKLPTEPFITHYVNKLTEAERTMDVNIKSCKTPVIFTCDDKDQLTFKRMFQEVDGNAPAVFCDRNINPDSITAYQTGVKFMGNDLMDYKRSVESDLLTFLGQNNTPVDKKERLITDEAEANNQLIESFADLQLSARQKACEEINNMFGLNVQVSRRVNKSVEKVEGNEDVQS
jgi:hypothetical protein